MRSKRRPPAYPSWPDDAFALRRRVRAVGWLERERLVALWMHGAATRAWVVNVLGWVSRVGDGWLWYIVIASLPWAGGPVGGSAVLRHG